MQHAGLKPQGACQHVSSWRDCGMKLSSTSECMTLKEEGLETVSQQEGQMVVAGTYHEYAQRSWVSRVL